jgi:hypothetical protein
MTPRISLPGPVPGLGHFNQALMGHSCQAPKCDYDHTGWNNEFYLQSGAVACHTEGFVVGVSKANRRLHALGTAESPETPLYMGSGEWLALLRASGPIEVVDWMCGEHGSETETTARLAWTASGITGSWRHYTCPPDHKFIDEEPIK